MKNLLSVIAVNFLTITVLLTLFSAPIYFARNFTQVAGVKTESTYLLVSQIAKFPNLTYEQVGENHKISITKQAQSQAFLSVFILNNPTETSKTYSIITVSGDPKVFFGEDLKNQLNKINIPAQSSAPISLLSQSPADTQSATFQIQAEWWFLNHEFRQPTSD